MAFSWSNSISAGQVITAALMSEIQTRITWINNNRYTNGNNNYTSNTHCNNHSDGCNRNYCGN